MIHTAGKTIGDIPTVVDVYFQTFKDDIVKYTNLSWSEEDNKGKSFYQWKVMQYYDLLYFLTIVYSEVNRLGDLVSWDYFVSKYKLDKIKECIACEGISWEKALAAFGLDMKDDNGVGFEQIEDNHQVYKEESVANILSIKDRIANPIICVNYIAAGIDPGIPEGDDQNFDTIQDTIDSDDEVIDT